MLIHVHQLVQFCVLVGRVLVKVPELPQSQESASTKMSSKPFPEEE